MAIRPHWCRLKSSRQKCKECGQTATWGVRFTADCMADDRSPKHFCDTCKPATGYRSTNPTIGAPKPFHNEFGRSNSDTSSNVSQSIPNWGTKIKARTA